MRLRDVITGPVLLTWGLLAGCAGGTPQAPPTALPRASFGAWAPPASPSTSTATSEVSGGWKLTVYYTAVQRLHDGEPETVTGCRVLDCAHGDADLGRYPADFVAAVKDEGTGRTAAGRYLNWSYDVGYWLDTAARDSAGARLRPFVTAAADPVVLSRGTKFRITACGRTDGGGAPATAVCAALRRGGWTVTDEFTPGLGGSRHVDLYIGEETGRDFTDSAWYLTLTGAALRR